jgi:hypothetical protein
MKKGKRLVRATLEKTKQGVMSVVVTKQRTYKVKFGMPKSEITIPKDASPSTNPECFCKTVRQDSVEDLALEVHKLHDNTICIRSKLGGSTGKAFRDYFWTGRSLRLVRAPLNDDRPLLTYEQTVDIGRTLIRL